MSSAEMNRLGLWLGLISGLLLIPEVVNLFPLERFDKVLERVLRILENISNVPQNLHPRSWKMVFSYDDRKNIIEPITAILGFVFSVTWLLTIGIGVVLSSKFLIALGVLLPIYIAVERIFQMHGFTLSPSKFMAFFVYSLILTFIFVPPVSIIRIFLLLLRVLVSQLLKFMSSRRILRPLITLLAILLFIVSNILQLLATY